MKTATGPKPVLNMGTLYEGDNGRIFCGACAGASATYTGRDISGQEVRRLTVDDADAFRAEMIRYGCPDLAEMCCESCGKTILSESGLEYVGDYDED